MRLHNRHGPHGRICSVHRGPAAPVYHHGYKYAVSVGNELRCPLVYLGVQIIIHLPWLFRDQPEDLAVETLSAPVLRHGCELMYVHSWKRSEKAFTN